MYSMLVVLIPLETAPHTRRGCRHAYGCIAQVCTFLYVPACPIRSPSKLHG